MPILHSPGRDDSRTVRSDQARFLAGHLRFDPHHVDHRDAFGDANDQLDPGIDRFQDSIRRAGGGNEDD